MNSTVLKKIMIVDDEAGILKVLSIGRRSKRKGRGGDRHGQQGCQSFARWVHRYGSISRSVRLQGGYRDDRACTADWQLRPPRHHSWPPGSCG